MAVPKCEGAFYFGHYISYDEYVDKYEAEVAKLSTALRKIQENLADDYIKDVMLPAHDKV